MDSNVDDLDDLLTHLAKYGGQLLFSNVAEETVKRIVGPGAVWPDLTRQQIAEEVWLEIEAGSSGNPNQAQQIANAQKIYPLVMQIPGIDPEFLARDLLHRLDDKLDLTQAFKSPLPSIVAMNTMSRGGPGGPRRQVSRRALAWRRREVAADAGAGRRPERAAEPSAGRQLPAADAGRKPRGRRRQPPAWAG